MLRGTWHAARMQATYAFMPGDERNTAMPKIILIKMVERQNYCAGAERFLHTILPFNGMEKE